MHKNIRSISLFCAAVVIVVPFVVFGSVTIGKEIWWGGDFSRYNHPLFVISSRQWRQGHIPLWNPHFFGGTPLIATQQASVFYPLNILMLLILPSWLMMGWSVLLHLSLSGLTIFLFLRSLRLHPLAAFLGGVTFQLGGFAMSHLGHLMILRALPWIGLALYGYNLWRETGKGRYFALISLSVSLLALSGHPQIIFYSFLLIGTYLLFGQPVNVRSTSLALLATALGILLGAIQLLPGVWMLLEGELASIDAIGPSFHPSYLLMLIFARIREGTYAEMVAYVGVGPFLLSLYSLLKREEKGRIRVKRFFVVWGVVALVLSCGQFIPFLFDGLSHIPLYGDVSRVPSRHLLEFSFSLSVLASFGLDGLINRSDHNKLRFVVPGLGAFLVGWSLFAVLTPLAENPSLVWSFSSQSIWLSLVLLLSNVLFLIFLWRVRTGNLRQVLIVLWFILVLFDLSKFGRSVYARSLTSPEIYTEPPPFVREIEAMLPATPFRITSLGHVNRDLLEPNFHAVYGFESLSGYDALMIHRFRSNFEREIYTWGYVGLYTLEDPNFRDFLDLYGVRFLLADSEAAETLDEHYVNLERREEGVIYLNPEARERLFPAFSPRTNLEGAQPFGDVLSIAGYSLDDSLSQASEQTEYEISTWWYCREPIAVDYTLYIHYVNNSGEVIAQDDHLLGRQTWDRLVSTSRWECPGYYRDISYIPRELVDAQDTDVALGIWVPETGERLAFSGELPVDQFGRVRLGSPGRFERIELEGILLDEYGREWFDPFPNVQDSVRILNYSDGLIEAEVDFDSEGILVHGTTYVSGWKATVDGMRVPVFRVHNLLQGINISEGRHQVEFFYRPDRFRWGSIMSSFSLIAILVVSIWLEYRSRTV